MFARLRHTMLPNLALKRIAAGFAVLLGLSVSGGDPDASPFWRIAASEPAPKEAGSVAAIVDEYVDALISDRHLYSESGVYPGPSFWEAPIWRAFVGELVRAVHVGAGIAASEPTLFGHPLAFAASTDVRVKHHAVKEGQYAGERSTRTSVTPPLSMPFTLPNRPGGNRTAPLLGRQAVHRALPTLGRGVLMDPATNFVWD